MLLVMKAITVPGVSSDAAAAAVWAVAVVVVVVDAASVVAVAVATTNISQLDGLQCIWRRTAIEARRKRLPGDTTVYVFTDAPAV